MEVLSFDLEGKLAHFRKYYANNTALSYFIPPRTTMMGVLAGILGLSRDSYYELLASDRLRIGVRALCNLKKSFHRLNLLKVEGDADFRGKKGRVQTPFEVVSAQNIREDMVKYRVYLSAYPDGEEVFQQLKKALMQNERVFATTLGLANLNASISNVQLYGGDEVSVQQVENGPVEVHSAIPSPMVNKLNGRPDKIWLEEELFPLDFVGNYDRELKKMQRLLFSLSELPLPLVISGTYIQLSKAGNVENICFIE